METSNTKTSNLLLWGLCMILGLVGIGSSVHAIITFNQANVIVEWTTASELNTAGFNLLRGETPAGPFEQINLAPIPASSDTLTGNSYSYEDSAVEAGKTYFYMLEEVENNGGANQHGPITVKASSPAKIELLIGGLLIIAAVVYGFILLKNIKPQEL